MDRGAWRAAVYGVAQSRPRLRNQTTPLGNVLHLAASSSPSVKGTAPTGLLPRPDLVRGPRDLPGRGAECSRERAAPSLGQRLSTLARGREAMGTQVKSQASSLRTHGLHLTEASPGRQTKEKASRVAGNKEPGSGKQVLPWMAGSRQRK